MKRQHEAVLSYRQAERAATEAKRQVRALQDALAEGTAALEEARKRGAALRAEAVVALRAGDTAKRSEQLLEADRVEQIEVPDLQAALDSTAGKLRAAAAQAEARAVELAEAEIALAKAARDRAEEAVRGPLLKQMVRAARVAVLDQRLALRWRLPLTDAHVGNGRGEDLFANPWPERNVAGVFVREFNELRRAPLPNDEDLIAEAIELLGGEV